MSHVTHMNESCHMYQYFYVGCRRSSAWHRCRTHEYMSCHTYEHEGMSHAWIQMSHGLCTNKSSRIYQCAMLAAVGAAPGTDVTHMNKCHVTRTNMKACDKYEYKWVVAHIWTSHVIHISAAMLTAVGAAPGAHARVIHTSVSTGIQTAALHGLVGMVYYSVLQSVALCCSVLQFGTRTCDPHIGVH